MRSSLRDCVPSNFLFKHISLHSILGFLGVHQLVEFSQFVLGSDPLSLCKCSGSPLLEMNRSRAAMKASVVMSLTNSKCTAFVQKQLKMARKALMKTGFLV